MKKLSVLFILALVVSCKEKNNSWKLLSTEKKVEAISKSIDKVAVPTPLVGMKCYLEVPESNEKAREVFVVDTPVGAERMKHEFYSVVEGTDKVVGLKINGTAVPAVNYQDSIYDNATYMINANNISLGKNISLDVEYDFESKNITLVKNTVDSKGTISDNVSFITDCEKNHEFFLSK